MNRYHKQAVLLLLFAAFLTLTMTACSTGVIAAKASEIPKFRLISTTTGELEPPTASEQQSASLVFDVDNDGVNDIVIGSRLKPGPYMVWYRSTSSGWQRYLIDDQSSVSMSPSGTFVDVDKDGDTDVIMGGSSDSFMIWWWENPYPDYEPNTAWPRHTIKTSGEPKHHDMLAADFDNDDSLELAFWNQYAHTLYLAELPDDPKSLENWPLKPVFTWEGKITFEGLEAADIDGDGWLDLAGAGRWFKNNGGESFTENVIDLDYAYDARVSVGQIVPGGWPEVVMGIGDREGRLEWFEWDGSAWKGHDLGPIDHGHSLQLVDINTDANLDIFAAEMRLDGGNEDSGMWFFLGDGQGQFSRALVASGYDNHENRVVDLDGDGDLDILGKPFNHETPALHIWVNDGIPLALDEWQRHVVDDDRPWRALFITAQDVDGDQHKDILTGGWWYQNPGAAQGGWRRQPFGDQLKNLAAVHDFDGDGDFDVLGTQGEGSDADNDFLWAQNDGTGGFTIHDNIQSGAGTFLQGVAVDRFNGEQLGVALSWHNDEADVQIIDVPADPLAERWTVRTLSPLNQSEGLDSGDIDRDGQIDLLLGEIWLSNASGEWRDSSVLETDGEPDRNLLADINGDGRLDAVLGFEAKSKAGKLAWYEQPEQSTERWTVRTLSPLNPSEGMDSGDIDRDGQIDLLLGKIWLSNASGEWRDSSVLETDGEPDRNLLADINGDGRLDAVLGFEAKSKAGKLAWYEQPAQSTEPWTEHLIADPPIIAPMSVDVADMDADGDLDVIAGEHFLEKPEKAGLFIFENLDGSGLSWEKHTVFVGDEHHVGAQVVDIDGDGDLDILSIGWNHTNVLLYENLARQAAEPVETEGAQEP